MARKRHSVFIVTSELAPYVKTGGLADMVAALAAGFKRKGHDVRVALPFYSQIKLSGMRYTTALNSMCVTMGIGEQWCAVRYVETPDKIPVYLIEHDAFFDRPGLYHDQGYNDYQDNPRRFGFFSRAALQIVLDLSLKPDIIHVNDWQTALVPVYLKTWFWNHPVLGRSASVLTIHNESYQGAYSAEHYKWLGLRDDDFTPDIFEDFKRVNLLKGGIYYADAVNTVSPTHAREISTPFEGFGLAPYISNKGKAFRGILNGVDYSTWSPEIDPLIPARYSAHDLSGKVVCKHYLQKHFHLEENSRIALIGFIGRLTTQKGIHLLKEIIERVVKDMVAQFVILGSGDPEYEHFFGTLPGRYPGKIGSYIGFNNDQAHLIEAGADFFVMPSLYEPCGLNQMYSLRYGTVPIVHATGGLDDTVENYDEKTGSGTGFKFWEISGNALYYTIGWAVSTYYDRSRHLLTLRQNAMKQDFSWDRSVKQYLQLYETAIHMKNEYDTRFE